MNGKELLSYGNVNGKELLIYSKIKRDGNVNGCGRDLGPCFELQGVSERLVGAPAATLPRLQDGGSPDNSGAAGKGLLTDFSLIFTSCRVCAHATFSFPSNGQFVWYICAPLVVPGVVNSRGPSAPPV